MRIEKAGAGQLGRVVELMRELAEFEELLDEFKVTEELLEKYVFGENSAAELIVGILDDEICGYALYFNNFSTFRGRPGMYLEDIYVAQDRRRQGLGKALLVEVMRVAREQGCQRLDWVVLDWNVRAQEFYKSLGAKLLKEWALCRMDDAAMDAVLGIGA